MPLVLTEPEYRAFARFADPGIAKLLDQVLERLVGDAGEAGAPVAFTGTAKLPATISGASHTATATQLVTTGASQGLQALLTNLESYNDTLDGVVITIVVTVMDPATPANQATMTGTVTPTAEGASHAPTWSAATVAGAYSAQGTHDVLLGSSAHQVLIGVTYTAAS